MLLVEDEPLVAMDVSCGLEDAGASVVRVALTVAEALAAAATDDIDVALLDGNLGGEPVDGVAQTLRNRAIPFCFVSGYEREHLPQGFDDAPVLTKPVDPDLLIRTIRRMAADRARTAPIRRAAPAGASR